mgnify:CR=1 FL=1
MILTVLKLHSPKGSCNFENCQNHSYLLITNCTRGRAISYTDSHSRSRELILSSTYPTDQQQVLELPQRSWIDFERKTSRWQRNCFQLQYVSVLCVITQALEARFPRVEERDRTPTRQSPRTLLALCDSLLFCQCSFHVPRS